MDIPTPLGHRKVFSAEFDTCAPMRSILVDPWFSVSTKVVRLSLARTMPSFVHTAMINDIKVSFLCGRFSEMAVLLVYPETSL